MRRRRARDGNHTVPGERLPDVNAHVEVSTGAGTARPTRVEDAAGRLVVVSWPTDASGYQVTGLPGDAVSLTWTSRLGVHQLDGTIVETSSQPVPLWSVRALAAPPANQRREAFRLDIRLPLGIVRDAAGEDARPVEATIVDLSEGGLGFVVAADAAPERGEALAATFPLDDGDITLRGTVVRLGEPAGGERGGWLRFDGMTEEAATRLRRYVLQEQIRRRSMVRD